MRLIIRKKFYAGSFVGLAGVLNAGIALSEDNAGIDSKKQGRVIEEIVVTATKREKSLRDIPASIAAVVGEDLEDSGAQGLSDYLETMPGIILNESIQGPNSNRVTVRGASMDTNTTVTSNTTGIFIGDTPLNDPYAAYVSPDLLPFDLKSVEVLKGPQGTLFGGSALAGILRYSVQPAYLDGWEFKWLGSYTTKEHGGAGHLYAAALNIPITDELAIRFVGHEREAPGVTDDARTGKKDIDKVDQDGGRIMVTWLPTERLSLDYTGLQQDSFQHDLGFVSDPDQGRRRDNTVRPSTNDSGFGLHSLRISYAMDWAEVVSVTSSMSKEVTFDADLSRAANGEVTPGADSSTLRSEFTVKSDGVMQELRLVSTQEGNWEWLVGVFAQDYELDFFQYLYAGLPNNPAALLPEPLAIIPNPEILALTADIDAHVDEIALFGDVTWTPWEPLSINFGFRWYDIDTSGTSVITYAGLVPNAIAEELNEKGLSPKLAATWQLRENLQLYSQVARGFRYGGLQTAAPVPVIDDGVPTTYKSDELWNYEIGLRSDWFERSLQADLTVYKIDWDDAQYSQAAPSGVSNTIQNVAAAEIEGAELSIRYLPPIDGLVLSLGASYVDSVTSEPFQDASGNDIAVGTRLPGSSRVQTSASIDYRTSIGSLVLDAGLNHIYLGEGFNTITHDERILGYGIFNASFGVSLPDFQYFPTLRINVQNLTNKYEVANVLTGGAIRDFLMTAPRTISLQLSGQF